MNEATEAFWLYVDREWGLPGRAEVAILLGTDPDLLPGNGSLLGVRLWQETVYPGFQFDRRTGRVLEAIPRLVSAARELGLGNEDLVFWLCSPSRHYGGDCPVEHLDDSDDVVEKLRLSESVEW
ncbi:hypothetical protein [Arthrobacter mobilis]|uniref:Antitoxin Xre/MbcA/ParS-like toxin-binding domain-containing protein n=1 Tax=Arthrobacter mobilis TaxID=2724944 RepID=A0A7X6HFP0_9MICC|nr:hypothetical protein [Arthrobacter mobilis]NKX55293.1 hypothetical protein [Arthrobacter mobilis]